MIYAETNLSTIKKSYTYSTFNPFKSLFDKLDFNKADWNKIRFKLSVYPWIDELQNLKTEQCYKKMIGVFSNISSDSCKLKCRKKF